MWRYKGVGLTFHRWCKDDQVVIEELAVFDQ